MSGIFTKIIEGEIPSYKIAENDDYFAFLDINPLAKGHTLVVPKIEVDYIFDLDDNILAGLHLFSKRVAQALEGTIDCKRVGVLVIGTEVPHAHVHLIPFQKESQMSITSERLSLDAEEMKVTASRASKFFLARNGNNATLVFGASLNEIRYSNKALKMLRSYNHEVLAIGGRIGAVEEVLILTGHPELSGVDTITMYVGKDGQKDHEDYLLSLKPRRIIFNPGAENRSFALKAKEQGVLVEQACTLVMLRTGQYSK